MSSRYRATGAVNPAVIMTPTVASVAAGASTLRKVASRVRKPPSNRISASAIEPTTIGHAHVVEFDAARSGLAREHADDQEHQQQRRPETGRNQARHDAGQNQERTEQNADTERVEKGDGVRLHDSHWKGCGAQRQ